MRSTVRIDDDLMTELKAQAQKENISLTRVLNRVVRQGLASSRSVKRERYKEETASLGRPRVEIDKALALAAELEDEEVIREISLRK